MAHELEKCVFYWWRHAFLCSTEIISLMLDHFLPKLQYVVAETIVYKTLIYHYSFWWRHHTCSLIFQKATMHNSANFHAMSVEDDFFWKLEFTWQWTLTPSLADIARFSSKFQYVVRVTETFSYRWCVCHFLIRCRDHA